MVQKASRARGRPPSFDREAVLDAAMRVLWQQGASRVRLADLEAATGVDRSSLYNSFEGKAGLLRAASRRYVDLVEADLFALLDADDGIARLLDQLAGFVASPDYPAGCLVVNDLADPAADASARDRYLSRLRSGLQAAVGREVERGTIQPAAADTEVARLLAGIVGANLLAGAGDLDAAREALGALWPPASRCPRA